MNLSNEIVINGRSIGPKHPPVVIAEIGINHGGSLEEALKIADSAIKAGAEIIKHQTHIIEDEMSEEAKNVIPGHTKESIYEIMNSCALSEKEEWELFKFVESRKCIFISTPFSRAAADRLIKFDIPAIKIGSGECNNYPLIKHIAKSKNPMIISTGMNTINTIKPTVEILRQNKIPYALLHCTNVYPTPPKLVRLGAINSIANAFPDAVIGLSDHTTSNYACLGAIAKGASILERHFTDDMQRNGPDIICSMNPESLSDLIRGSKIIFEANGGEKEPVKEENPTIAFAFASVVAIKDIYPGELLNKDNIWLKRPGGGDFNANNYESLIGKKCIEFIKNGYQIKKSQVDC